MPDPLLPVPHFHQNIEASAWLLVLARVLYLVEITLLECPMDAVTVLTWLAAGEGEHIEFKERYNSRCSCQASPCTGAAWTDLDDAALRKYFSACGPGVLDQPGLTLEALATGQRFAIRRGADVVPTVAGCVLFGSHPEWLQPIGASPRYASVAPRSPR